MSEIITITGDVGSGKSTVGKILAASLGYEHISTGAIHREVARSRGITTLQLNEQSMEDREIDDAIDSHVQRLGNEGKRLVLDSRMAWHFVPSAFKIFVTVDPFIGAQRVLSDQRSEEAHDGVADAVRNNLRRKSLEDIRFAKLYGVRCERPGNFDLVVDSTWVTPECVANVSRDAFGRHPDEGVQPRGYLCPRSLYPTRGVTEVDTHHADDTLASATAAGVDAMLPVEIVRFAHYFFVHDGHERVSDALRLGVDHVPCVLRAMDEETGIAGRKFGEEVRASLRQPWISDWEEAHGFSFCSYPDADGNPRCD